MKKKLVMLTSLLITVIVVYVVSIVDLQKVSKIDIILASENYSYLPVEAKDYIKEVYEDTGEIVLTEKNKKEGEPYLNPKYAAYLSLSEEEKEQEEIIPSVYAIEFSSTKVVEDKTYPSKYNLTNVNNKQYVSDFKNQGSLGICWAFATIEQVESYLMIEKTESYSPSSSEVFSARQMDYAVSTNGIKNYTNENGQRELTSGGNYWLSSLIMAQGLSLVDDSKMPFNEDKSQKELATVLNYGNSKYELESSIIVPTTTSTTDSVTKQNYNNFLKENIMKYGGAYVGTGSPSGSCGFTNKDATYAMLDDGECSKTNGHAMQIIGWDDNYEYAYCQYNNQKYKATPSGTCTIGTPKTGKGAWILRNSWGSASTRKYVYLVYDSYELEVAFTTGLSSMENKTWDNNYHKNMFYKGTFSEFTYRTSTVDTIQYQKKINTKEKVEKVKFLAFQEGGEYTLSIKVGNKNYTNVKTVTTDNVGIYTINLSDQNIILDGENFEVTVRSTNGKSLVQNTISVFTSNVDSTPIIKTGDLSYTLDNTGNNYAFIVYSDTKNIPSNSRISYSLYKDGRDYSSYIVSVSNDKVAINNVNSTLVLNGTIPSGTYQLKTSYNGYTSTSNFAITYNQDLEGSGTATDPYLIYTGSDLAKIKNDLEAYYLLKNDIDLTEDTRAGGSLSMPAKRCSQGFGWEAISNFSGTLDGNGHTIKGLYQNNYIECHISTGDLLEWHDNGNGLFASTSGNVRIKNLVLEDFEMNCQGGSCGILVSKHIGDSGHATFENIVVRNSKIKGTYNPDNSDSSLKNVYGGGLFGTLVESNGTISISNIYLDIDIDTVEIKKTAYLASSVEGNIDIQNVQLMGELIGKNSDGSNDSLLIHTNYGNVTIQNVLSTVTTKNVGGLLGEVWNDKLSISNVNMLKISDKGLCYRDDKGFCTNGVNINIYDKDNELAELTKKENYVWKGFDTNWTIKTINGITRIPVLSFVKFQYTSVSNISLNHQLNKPANIYDYLSPTISSAKRVKYNSNNEAVVKIDSDGNLIPQAAGTTTIHLESYYDGFIGDVPITVSYAPHYSVVFDANGGIGTMDSIEVSVNTNYNLPKNTFTRENYVFKEWNTKADGTGESYQNLGQVKALQDKETITLYAQWIGEERTVTFNANGGTVTPGSKVVRYGDTYGDLPIPTREGYAFLGWSSNGMLIDSNTKFLGNTNLVASWREDAYTIIYDANGGSLRKDYEPENKADIMSNTIAVTIGLNNVNQELVDNLYERNGYKFVGWNTKADGSGFSYQGNAIINLYDVENSTLHLYAQWKLEDRKITFYANDGTTKKMVQTVIIAGSVPLVKNTFTREGYKFIGWNTKADGTGLSYLDESLITFDGSIELYAQWEKVIPYIIETYSYDADKKYISKITVGTEVTDFRKNIKVANGYSVIVDVKVIDGKSLIFTGGKTKIYKDQEPYEELINIVIGDINGDGAINSADLLKMRQHLLGTELSGAYRIAADINYDNLINSADLLRIRQHLLGSKQIS